MGRPIDLPLRLLTLCFFGSGLTGLVYELVWTRRLQLVFGSTTYSVTTVLAAFMAGLGIGSYLIGRRVDRSPEQGARIYAYLEIGVAIYAAISLPLISGVEWLYGVMQRSLELSPSGAALLKLALAFPVLALPAGMMGGTLPALVRATVRRRQGLHRAVGRLYGVNTIGAAVGTLLTGMLLIELLGLWRTVLLSATVNAGIGILVLSRLRAAERAVKEAARHREGPPEREEALEERERAAPPVPAVGLRYHLRRPDVLFCALAVVLTGVLSMSYEVVWTRLLGLVMGSSTYAFTIVLGIFLVGIASGALLYSRIARGREPSALGLAQLLCALAIWVALTLAFIPSLPRMLMALAQLPGLSFSRVLLFEIVFATALLLVPTLLLGAALPMAMGIVSRALGQIGRDVGGIYLANTLGAIAGSVLTGFLLVPWLGCQRTLVAGLVANVILVGVGFGAFARRPLLRAFGGAIAALIGMMAVAQAPWPAVLFDSGLAYRLHEVNAKSNLELEKRLRRLPNKLLFRSEGVNATISVRQFEEGITLLVNGKPDASTSTDMATQVVLGGLAALIHPAPRDVNIVGWGSGVTARTVSLLPEVRRLDVIEIERAVLAASRYFHPVNGAIERDKRVKVYYDDARSFYLTNERRYDVIISEPSNPWMVGVSGLFSADFYALAKRRLKPGGIFGQWLQLYRVDARAVALVLRTVRQAFRHVQLWLSDPFDVMLVASDSPIRPSRDRIATAYRQAPELARLMAAYGPGRTPDAFFGCYLLGEKSLARVAARLGDAVMTDDRPVLEYRAVRDIYRPTRHHLRALMSLKLAAGDILPPLAKGSTPPALGAVIAGAAAL
ncbi:MAG: fused MFS/spermidine synthase, partial [Myxococcales bacterium]|nr:fused MFS/spermidine synthase [Myxococcales bacterium]